MSSEEDSDFDSSQKVSRPRGRKFQRNVFTRMEGARGPMALFQKAVTEKLRIRVVIRNAVHIRGICTGFLVAFDWHCNLALVDVDETYKNPAEIVNPNKPKKKRVRQRKKKIPTPEEISKADYVDVMQLDGHADSSDDESKKKPQKESSSATRSYKSGHSRRRNSYEKRSESNTREKEQRNTQRKTDERNTHREREEKNTKIREKSNTRSEREEKSTGKEREGRPIGKRRDQSNTRSERDKSNTHTQRNESNLQKVRDESNIQSEIDERNARKERDEDNTRKGIREDNTQSKYKIKERSTHKDTSRTGRNTRRLRYEDSNSGEKDKRNTRKEGDERNSQREKTGSFHHDSSKDGSSRDGKMGDLSSIAACSHSRHRSRREQEECNVPETAKRERTKSQSSHERKSRPATPVGRERRKDPSESNSYGKDRSLCSFIDENVKPSLKASSDSKTKRHSPASCQQRLEDIVQTDTVSSRVLQRHVNQLFIRGDNVVLVSIADCIS